VSSTGYSSPRPGFRGMTRLSDGAAVLVNLHLVRTIEPVANGVRIAFGPQPQDRIDVAMTVEQLIDLVNQWQIG